MSSENRCSIFRRNFAESVCLSVITWVDYGSKTATLIAVEVHDALFRVHTIERTAGAVKFVFSLNTVV